MEVNDLLTWSLSQSWFLWAMGLILVFPLAIVVLGEAIHRLELTGSAWVAPLKNIRHLVLPQLVLLLIMAHLLGLPDQSVWVRIVETTLWISVIHTILSALNVLIFAGTDSGDSMSWRGRLPKLVVDFARAFLVMVGASLVLSYVWGVELGRLLTALGVGSIVLGLALQDTLGSLFSGFALLSSRQFRVGDWLEVGNGDTGKVIGMNWRTVTLLTRDEDILIVPNAELAKGRFLNFSYPYPRHREKVTFDLSFDDAPYRVKEALTEAALATPGILSDPPPVVALISYDEFSVKHEVRYFIADFADQPRILDDFISRVWYVVKRHGLAFPTRAHEVQIIRDAKGQTGERQQIESELRALPFLRSCEAQIPMLAKHARVLDFATGENIIRQGETTSSLFIVITGNAAESFIDPEGQQHDINTLGNRDFFGITALVRNLPSDVSVRCLSDVQVISIERRAVQHLLETNPKLAVSMEQVVEGRLREVHILEKKTAIRDEGTDTSEGHDDNTVVNLNTIIRRQHR